LIYLVAAQASLPPRRLSWKVLVEVASHELLPASYHSLICST